MNKIMKACDFIIFGTKGDLAKRKLLPSLYYLEKFKYIHKDTRIIGVGRANWKNEEYINLVKKSLINFLNEKIDKKIWIKFSSRLKFCNLDIYHINNFLNLKNILNKKNNILINYFAMPSNTFVDICKGLKKIKINNKLSRIVLEKPLGNNLKTYNQINNKILKYFNESQIYRIDHYLGKETILNLLILRFANNLFFSNWDNNIIDSVQITISEEVGIEGRFEYFDKVGQMRDMVQNHLLQILLLITMSIPLNLNSKSIKNEKIKILRSLRCIDYNNVEKKTVIGQYTSGIINNKTVSSYLEEIGLNKKSNTETFVSIRVDIDNFKWSGVPFYLRTGKRLNKKLSEIVIYYKKLPINLFNDNIKELPQNKLIIRLQPNEGIEIHILNKILNLKNKYNLQLNKLNLNFYKKNDKNHKPDAYERLILEIMKGIKTLFISHEEIEESWKWVDSIINGWKEKKMTPILYKSGSWGPEESNNLLKNDKRYWN
ncbi:glucose-6-phosphate dehydrogenase [Enterobacterales bacterium endosymbiont of Anomoneura mori]|uniref:glucose-6-phosphate dehydrogenase n=1 Tax=Enterobacterales bacterium endosymbiont of Anomoneura mori TaxID=3132096 RepID=UPI00399D475E